MRKKDGVSVCLLKLKPLLHDKGLFVADQQLAHFVHTLARCASNPLFAFKIDFCGIIKVLITENGQKVCV